VRRGYFTCKTLTSDSHLSFPSSLPFSSGLAYFYKSSSKPCFLVPRPHGPGHRIYLVLPNLPPRSRPPRNRSHNPRILPLPHPHSPRSSSTNNRSSYSSIRQTQAAAQANHSRCSSSAQKTVPARIPQSQSYGEPSQLSPNQHCNRMLIRRRRRLRGGCGAIFMIVSSLEKEDRQLI
jgi:hypothetical protein